MVIFGKYFTFLNLSSQATSFYLRYCYSVSIFFFNEVWIHSQMPRSTAKATNLDAEMFWAAKSFWWGKKVWIHSQMPRSTSKCRKTATFLGAERFWAAERIWWGENKCGSTANCQKWRMMNDFGLQKSFCGGKQSWDPQTNAWVQILMPRSISVNVNSYSEI